MSQICDKNSNAVINFEAHTGSHLLGKQQIQKDENHTYQNEYVESRLLSNGRDF